MRTLIVTNIVSLDGCYAGPGGNVMALPMDDSFDTYNAERLAAADTRLLGASQPWPPTRATTYLAVSRPPRRRRWTQPGTACCR